MEFRFSCPKCKQKFKAELEQAGSVVDCPSCKSEFRVPNAQPIPPVLRDSTNTFKIDCPHCGQPLTASQEYIGYTTTCRSCNADFEVTAPAVPAVPIEPTIATQPASKVPARKRNPLLVPLVVVSVLLIVTTYYTFEYWRIRNALSSLANAFSKPEKFEAPKNSSTVHKAAALPPRVKPPLKLVSWDYNYKKSDFSGSYRIRTLIKNTGSKGIKMVEASVVFSDLLDNRLYAIGLDPDIYVAPGAEKDDTGTYRINQFMNEQTRMKSMKKEDVKATLVVRKIVFSDNSVFESQD